MTGAGAGEMRNERATETSIAGRLLDAARFPEERRELGSFIGRFEVVRLLGRGRVSFTPDGRWLATTAEGDPIAHLWLVDWAELTRALRAATTACLTPEQRMKNLDESAATARAAWERCERRNGRRP